MHCKWHQIKASAKSTNVNIKSKMFFCGYGFYHVLENISSVLHTHTRTHTRPVPLVSAKHLFLK